MRTAYVIPAVGTVLAFREATTVAIPLAFDEPEKRYFEQAIEAPDCCGLPLIDDDRFPIDDVVARRIESFCIAPPQLMVTSLSPRRFSNCIRLTAYPDMPLGQLRNHMTVRAVSAALVAWPDVRILVEVPPWEGNRGCVYEIVALLREHGVSAVSDLHMGDDGRRRTFLVATKWKISPKTVKDVLR